MEYIRNIENDYNFKLEINLNDNIETLTGENDRISITQPFGTFFFDFLSIDIDKLKEVLLSHGILKMLDNKKYRYRMNKRDTLKDIEDDIYSLSKEIIDSTNKKVMELHYLTDGFHSKVDYDLSIEFPEYFDIDVNGDIIRDYNFYERHLYSDNYYCGIIEKYDVLNTFLNKYIHDPFFHNPEFIKFLIYSNKMVSPYEHLYNQTMNEKSDLDTLKKYYIDNISHNNIYTYYINNLYDLYDLTLYHIVTFNYIIKKCENCGRYFYPQTRDDEIYCNNIYKNNKTCKQIGYEIKANQDDILNPYRKIYKTQNARKQRNKHINNIDARFSKWSKHANSILKKCQDGKITIDKMKQLISGDEWMKENWEGDVK